MTTKRRAPIEVLEQLAMAVCEDEDHGRLMDISEHCRTALRNLRAATAQVRTRVEVDAEIADVVRMLADIGAIPGMAKSNADELYRLCREPTQPNFGASETGDT
jgi:hypothetical protein